MHESADFIITLFIILSILTLAAIIYSIFERGDEKKKLAHTSANTPMDNIPHKPCTVNCMSADWRIRQQIHDEEVERKHHAEQEKQRKQFDFRV